MVMPFLSKLCTLGTDSLSRLNFCIILIERRKFSPINLIVYSHTCHLMNDFDGKIYNTFYNNLTDCKLLDL